MLVFVYGTLKRGENAHGMLGGASYVGTYHLEEYAMYQISSYPGIVPMRGGRVVGEVYEVPLTMIPRLDAYEGEGMLYRRVVRTVSNEVEDLTAQVYEYLGSVKGKEKLCGEWSAGREGKCDGKK